MVTRVYGPTTGRDVATARPYYGEMCDKAIDAYYGGESWMPHLKRALIQRLGTAEDTKQARGTDEIMDEVFDRSEHTTDAGRVIRQEVMELVTLPTVESIVHDLAKLYSADNQRRVYLRGKDQVEKVEEVIEDYHQRGGLPARNVMLDGLTVLLRMAAMRVDWCADLKRISYQVMPPHWVDVWDNPRWPLTVELAYAVVWSESMTEKGEEKRGEESREPVWCMYIRPPLENSDDPDAPTWRYPEGRFVRYKAKEAFPPPEPGDDKIIEDSVNPFYEIGGMNDGRRIWNPIVWNWSRPPLEKVHLPPDSSLVRVMLEIDVAFSLCMRLANTQSNGQPVMTGPGSPPTSLGPQTLVRIQDPQGNFFYASPNAKQTDYINTIRALFQTYGMLKKMTPDSWSIQRPSIQTGPAKKLEQMGLTEVRWERSLMADDYESKRFDIERLYHNAYGDGEKIPWDIKQEMHWGELRVPVDRNEQVTRIAQELAIETISRLDAIMETHGIDKSAAEAKIKEIDGVTEEIVEGTDVDKPVPEKAVDPKTALNGAQVTAMADIVSQVSRGDIPRDSAVAMLASAFPINKEIAEKIVGTAGKGFIPANTSNPATTPGAVETSSDRDEDEEINGNRGDDRNPD